jgi:hypothetical protein
MVQSAGPPRNPVAASATEFLTAIQIRVDKKTPKLAFKLFVRNDKTGSGGTIRTCGLQGTNLGGLSADL